MTSAQVLISDSGLGWGWNPSTLNSVNHPQSPTYMYSNVFSHCRFQVPLNTSFLIKLIRIRTRVQLWLHKLRIFIRLKVFVIEFFCHFYEFRIAIYVSTNRGNIQHELFYMNVTLIYICLLLSTIQIFIRVNRSSTRSYGWYEYSVSINIMFSKNYLDLEKTVEIW